MRNVLVLMILFCGVCSLPLDARAGTIWQWTHQAEGEGWANVFDGGDPEFDAGATLSPDAPGMAFAARDWSDRPPLGARAGVSGRSTVYPHDEQLGVVVAFAVAYSAQFAPNADWPGGASEGALSSVVEFVMPADQLEWSLGMSVQRGGGYTGTAHFILKNVTRSTIIAEAEGETGFQETLYGQVGDVVRLTVEMDGSGSYPPDIPGFARYDVFLTTSFMIPEPSTHCMLVLGVLALTACGRQGDFVATPSPLIAGLEET